MLGNGIILLAKAVEDSFHYPQIRTPSMRAAAALTFCHPERSLQSEEPVLSLSKEPRNTSQGVRTPSSSLEAQCPSFERLNGSHPLRVNSNPLERFGVCCEVLRCAQDDTHFCAAFSLDARFKKMWVMERVLCRLRGSNNPSHTPSIYPPQKALSSGSSVIAAAVIDASRGHAFSQGGTGLPHSRTLARSSKLPTHSKVPSVQNRLNEQDLASSLRPLPQTLFSYHPAAFPPLRATCFRHS